MPTNNIQLAIIAVLLAIAAFLTAPSVRGVLARIGDVGRAELTVCLALNDIGKANDSPVCRRLLDREEPPISNVFLTSYE